MFFLLFPFPSIILKPLDGATHSRHLYWGGRTVAEHEALGGGRMKKASHMGHLGAECPSLSGMSRAPPNKGFQAWGAGA